ncbi:SPT16-domain-containing protein [Ramicandelaber brevisporus]|nr:SPT16-domain-containing protein [Ramicandelaber brevisporus]
MSSNGTAATAATAAAATGGLDAKVFHDRAAQLIAALAGRPKGNNAADLGELAQIDAVVAAVGKIDDAPSPYQKSIALQAWLLGTAAVNIAIVVTKTDVHIVANARKLDLLGILKSPGSSVSNPVSVILHAWSKEVSEQESMVSSLVNKVFGSSAAGKKLGLFPKDNTSGAFITGWQATLDKYVSSNGVERVDASPHIASLLAPKSESEVGILRTASKLSAGFMNEVFVKLMTDVIEEERNITNEGVAELVDNSIRDDSQRKLIKGVSPEWEESEWCYTPIIQSGQSFELKPSAASTSDKFTPTTVIASLGVRYKSYCSNVARTFFIDPSNTQQKVYEFLCDLQKQVINTGIKDGVLLSDIYKGAVTFVHSRRPDLESKLVKNIGFVTGIEFREASYVIGPKCNSILRNGMVINLSLGFQDVDNTGNKKNNKKFSALIIDTVLVSPDGPVILTKDVSKNISDVIFSFGDEDEEEDIKVVDNKGKGKSQAKSSLARDVIDGPVGGGRTTRQSAAAGSNRRGGGGSEPIGGGMTDAEERKLREHQIELFEKLQSEGLRKYTGLEEGQLTEESAQFKYFESYKSENKLPTVLTQQLEITIDEKNDTIILPIYGQAVPFHISTLKNVSKSDEFDHVALRFNFVSPGQGAGKKDVGSGIIGGGFADPNATFIRTITFRNTDSVRMQSLFQKITDLKKAQAKREAAKKDLQDLVEQDSLIELKGQRPYRLSEVYPRPQMEGRRSNGSVTIQQNGIRFQHSIRSDLKIDVLFSNMKHLFFQPCDNELLVVLHIHLKHPIMVNKKKTHDIQFIKEVTEVLGQDTSGMGRNRRARVQYGDEDEIQAEEEERRKRREVNKTFKNFAEQIALASNGQVDIDAPIKNYGFSGVPARSSVNMYPTNNALIQLIETPFFIVTVSEVELAFFERIQFGLKNFDLVFVFKDFKRTPVHINSIDTKSLLTIKKWLDSVDIPFGEGQVNMNWTAIMKVVNDDPEAFFEDGGWRTIVGSDLAGGDGGAGGSSDEESDEESAYNPSGSDVGSEDEASSSDYGSSGSDMSDESDFDEESGSEVSLDSDEESGEDWDELERKAKRDDDKRGHHSDDDDDDDNRRGKRKGGGGGSGPAVKRRR